MAELVGIVLRDVVFIVILAWITEKLKLEPFVKLVVCCAGPLLFSPSFAYLAGYGSDGRVLLELIIGALVVAVFLLRIYLKSRKPA
jgi:hypothetical protein